jgi:hypothetical protein
LRKIHRWLGLLIALQIMAWMASGLYFAVFPIETIRGEHLVRPAELFDPEGLLDLVPAWVAWNNAAIHLGEEIEKGGISLVTRDGIAYYRISGQVAGQPFVRLVEGSSGGVVPRIGPQGAEALARSLLEQPGELEAVEWVTELPPGNEVRGRTLPLWRVRFSQPESLSLWIEPWTGEVLARRTTRWRIFDFLWMLHIMDFDERDDFNTPLLMTASFLGLLIALSGVVYWAMTTTLWRRRRA